jgi:hypothetical protein
MVSLATTATEAWLKESRQLFGWNISWHTERTDWTFLAVSWPNNSSLNYSITSCLPILFNLLLTVLQLATVNLRILQKWHVRRDVRLLSNGRNDPLLFSTIDYVKLSCLLLSHRQVAIISCSECESGLCSYALAACRHVHTRRGSIFPLVFYVLLVSWYALYCDGDKCCVIAVT